MFDLDKLFRKPQFNGSKKAKHVIMISFDALYEQDFDIIKNMPAFKKLIDKGSYSKEVTSIYPTLTYVVHTSIITGSYPDKHGIIHNHQLQPGITEERQKWYWYRREIKASTIFDKLAEQNMTTASILWPVTGKSNINYNLPEILALPGENQILKIFTAGSPLFLIREELKNGKYRRGAEQPYLDMYATKIAVDTIKTKKPNLLTIHLVALDTFRHNFGVNSKEAIDGLQIYNDSLAEIVQATKDAGIYDDTVFVITSDHGLIDINYNVYINNLFYREGLIELKDNKLVSYKAYCQSTGCGAFIYIKDNDKKIEKLAKNILENAMKESKYGISKIYTRSELKKLHGDLSYAFAIEAESGYNFKDDITEYDIKPQSDYGKKYATHGYSPDRVGYKNIFIVSGKCTKKRYDIGRMEMVDIAPTVTEILGVKYDCDGKAIKGIFCDTNI